MFESQISVDEFWRRSLCVGVVAKSLPALMGVSAANETERAIYFPEIVQNGSRN